ncbi:heterogeneous nuclear ribonucleoprotein Q isoform X3 [Zea mays]|nr:heterogeneous nuclear ribonucleoprotein Q isoform X3 [Zea mays]|eukprot:XP_008662372.3 heterogeneous nuclear ribonucleoprotein Q isoform X3 [Zea mays]
MRELKSGRGNLVGLRLGEPKHCRPGSLASVRLPPRVPLFRSPPPPHPSPSHCAPSIPPCLRRLGGLPLPSLSRAKSAHQFPWIFELWKMPRWTENSASTKSAELVKQQDRLEFDDPDEVDEEEEVEYEEVEEEVEYEETEDEYGQTEAVRQVDAKHDSKMVDADTDEGGKGSHDELLALPPHGSEVYVGGIASDVSSDDLKKLCESVGEVVEVRMPGKSGRLYAFVNFRTKELASKAIQKLNNKDLKGKKIRVSSSQAKNRLFIGNIPYNWTENEFKKAAEEVGPGVLKVNLVKAPHSDTNKGYGFIEYYNQACAEYAKKMMSTPEFKLDKNAPNVSWADTKNGGESASTAQVKSLYVKNLPKAVTQEQLKKLFEHLGEVTKVVIPPAKAGHENRYGFVHFKERSMAMKALEDTERFELDGQLLDCSLAKPLADKKDDTSAPKGGPLLPSYTPVGYGLMGAYNPLGNGLAVAGAYNPYGNGLAGAYGVLGAHAAQLEPAVRASPLAARSSARPNVVCSRCSSRFDNDPNGSTRWSSCIRTTACRTAACAHDFASAATAR